MTKFTVIEHRVDRLWRDFKVAHAQAAKSAMPGDAVYAAKCFGFVLSELNSIGEAGRQAFMRRVADQQFEALKRGADAT